MINNKNDWWNAVNEHWDHLLEIIAHHIDINHIAYETPRDSDSQMTGRTILEEIHLLKRNCDPKLARYIVASWALASEAYAWSVPSWGVLCDLCSEEYVLYPEHGEDHE